MQLNVSTRPKPADWSERLSPLRVDGMPLDTAVASSCTNGEGHSKMDGHHVTLQERPAQGGTAFPFGRTASRLPKSGP